MDNQKKVAVVIPYYKEELNELEIIAFEQVKKILGNYPIYAVLPEKMQKSNTFTVEKIFFEDRYFESVKTYNKLMLSQEFYYKFREYKYILIYQLDAFVFEDRLMDFCEMDYDYIGAPWLQGQFYYLDSKHIIWHVGNGGFSLRKVKSCIKVLSDNQEFLNDFDKNEDFFFGIYSGVEFKVAPLDVALDFSFECDVKECFRLNNSRLPFGCHAWERYDFSFWKKHMEKQGYCISECAIETGDEDYREIENKKQLVRKNEFFEKKYTSQLLKTVMDEILYENGVSDISIWGAGFWGRNWIKMLSESGYNIQNVFDANETLWNTEIYNYLISPIEMLKKEQETLILVTMNISKKNIEEEIRKLGIEQELKYILGAEVLQRMNRYMR